MGGREVLEHSGGARLRVGLAGAHRLGLERTGSMSHFKTEKRPMVGGVMVVDSGPRAENNRNWCVL
jgi:hypothetical protein